MLTVRKYLKLPSRSCHYSTG